MNTQLLQKNYEYSVTSNNQPKMKLGWENFGPEIALWANSKTCAYWSIWQDKRKNIDIFKDILRLVLSQCKSRSVIYISFGFFREKQENQMLEILEQMPSNWRFKQTRKSKRMKS